MSQQLAELLGGHIAVESELGMGSVFRLRLALPQRNSARANPTGLAKVESDDEWRSPTQTVVPEFKAQCPAWDFAHNSAKVDAKGLCSATCMRFSQATYPDSDATGNRVLIVEDHRALALLTQQQLRRYGYDVRVAHNGKEAKQQIAGWKPTTVIMDLVLPDTRGMALCRSM